MGFHPGGLFGIQIDCRNGVARFALRGELDMATARSSKSTSCSSSRMASGRCLDLRDLTFVDSTGLHTFLKAQSRAADNGHRFALVGANGQLKRILEVTATQGVLDEKEGVRLLARFARSSPRTSVDAEWNSDG